MRTTDIRALRSHQGAAAVVALILAAASGCQLLGGFAAFGGPPAGDAATTSDGVAEASKAANPCGLTYTAKAQPARPGVLRLIGSSAGSPPCFWADEDEVTVADFETWRADAGGGWGPGCTWKTGISDPVAAWSDAGGSPSDVACVGSLWKDESTTPFNPENPIRCVDWCDAERFCEGVGERLCMAGAGTPGSATDTIDEFGALCGGPQDDFEPYGTVAQTGVCNVGWSEDAGCVVNTNGGAVFGCGPLPSTTYPGCVSPGGINAAVGNVQEWVHDCELAPADAAAVVCFRAGGSFATPLANASCSSLGSVPAARSAKDPFTGIRCCADLTPEEQTKAAGP